MTFHWTHWVHSVSVLSLRLVNSLCVILTRWWISSRLLILATTTKKKLMFKLYADWRFLRIQYYHISSCKEKLECCRKPILCYNIILWPIPDQLTVTGNVSWFHIFFLNYRFLIKAILVSSYLIRIYQSLNLSIPHCFSHILVYY
jgi:hypothetical protein